jgi:adenylosuccinate synthase
MLGISAVIGANYGDEGKGLVVDALSDSKTLVVRYNGGAQAGHTVVTPDGRRHAFSHVGAGVFNGAATLLSRFFIVNPVGLWNEMWALNTNFGLFPRIYIDPVAVITTPYDIAINQAVEKARGSLCHGSCGVGINETVERSENFRYRITMADLRLPGVIQRKLKKIEEEWVPFRCAELGLSAVVLESSALESWLGLLKWLNEFPQRQDGQVIKAVRGQVIFEGAQGLCLDQTKGKFPHVTRSNTGVKNIAQILSQAGIDEEVKLIYTTRCYLTRHGRGELPSEISGNRPPWPGIVDETNVPNEWQGTLRYALLEPVSFFERIHVDQIDARGLISTIRHIAMTCMDQLPKWMDKYLMLDEFQATMYSAGPTRETFKSEIV